MKSFRMLFAERLRVVERTARTVGLFDLADAAREAADVVDAGRNGPAPRGARVTVGELFAAAFAPEVTESRFVSDDETILMWGNIRGDDTDWTPLRVITRRR